MDIAFDIALLAHLLALVAAGAAVVGIPVVAGRMAAVGPEVRPLLGGIMGQLGRVSQVAFAALIVSGPLLVWLRYGGVDGMTAWFWVKMALIVVMAIAFGVAGRFRAMAQRGNRSAGMVAEVAGWVSRIALAGIIAAAVLAFN